MNFNIFEMLKFIAINIFFHVQIALFLVSGSFFVLASGSFWYNPGGL